MADETKVDEFLGDLANNGTSDPFSETPDELFETKEESKKEEVIEEKVEKALPFNKDPKIQRFISKEVEKKLAERVEKPVVESKVESESPYGDILKEIIGDDTPEKRNAIDKFNRTFLEREEKIAGRSLDAINAERQAEIQAEAEADETLASGFEGIDEEFGVDLYAPENKKLKGQFIDYIQKIAPKDAQGEISDFPDIRGAFETFQSIRQRPSQTGKGKELAANSIERGSNSPAPTNQEPVTFDNLDGIFDKMSG